MAGETLKQLMFQSMHEVKTAFHEVENTDELCSCARKIIPLQDEDYKIVSVKGTSSKFKVILKCSLSNEYDLEEFIKNYGIRNNETLRVSKTKNIADNKSQYQMYKYFRCHHNTRHEPTMRPNDVLTAKPHKRFKNTNCEFSLIARLPRKKGEYLAEVSIEWNHNHPTNSLHALSFKEIPGEVVDTIKDMFARGLLPGAAHKEFMRILRSECKDEKEYHLRLADRSKVPRRADFNDIYTSFNKNLYGTENLKSMFAKIKERIAALEQKDDEYSMVLQEFDETINQPFILTVITPLMKRIHKWV